MHLSGAYTEGPSTAARLTPRALSVTLVAALSCFLLAAILFAGWRDYESSRSKAVIRAAGAARLLESHLRWLVTSANLALGNIDATGSAEHLDKLAFLLPVAGSLSAYDSDGTLVHTTSPAAAGAPSQPEPDYLVALRHGRADVFVGSITEPGAGGGRFVVARALRDVEGQLRMVVVAQLALEDIVQGIDLGPDSVLGVFRSDGGMVFRWPHSEDIQAGERVRGASLFNERLDSTEGIFESVSTLDGVERIIAYRRLHDLGLVVVAGPSRAHSMADMHGHIGRLALFGAPALVMVLALMVLAVRSMHKEAVARAAAREAVQTKLHFISGTYHDLGQILLALDLFLSRLRETAGEVQLDAVEGADAAVRSAHDLLDTIMDASQLASGGVRVHICEVHVRDILDRIALEVEPRAAQKGLRLSVRGGDMVGLSDPHLLERIVRNLAVNAIKFTSVGGVVLACRPVGDQVSIEVWDTGPGIPEAEHRDIFTPFHRAGRPLPARGMGLGLSIVDRFTTLLGHKVSLTSRVGRGSVFKFRLPRVMLARRDFPRMIGETGNGGMADDNAPIGDGIDHHDLCNGGAASRRASG